VTFFRGYLNRVGLIDFGPFSLSEVDSKNNPTGESIPIDAISIRSVGRLKRTETKLADAMGEPTPLQTPRNRLVDAGLVAVSVAAAAIAFALVRRSIVTRRRRFISARRKAERKLAQIESSGLASTDPRRSVRETTEVVRQLIEATTSVSAPKKTTEEFLREIAGHPSFTPVDQERLRGFFESADMVKFGDAGRPDELAGLASENLGSAKRLVERFGDEDRKSESSGGATSSGDIVAKSFVEQDRFFSVDKSAKATLEPAPRGGRL
jgi:hypothetical protein